MISALMHQSMRWPPMSQMICLLESFLMESFDKFPGARIGFMEAGSAWLLTCMERHRAPGKHVQHDPRGRFLQLRKGEKIIDYILRHIDEGRIFIGCEGEEPDPLRRYASRATSRSFLHRLPA